MSKPASPMSAAPSQQQLPPVWAIVIPVFIELVLTFSIFFSDSYFLSRISDQVAAGVGTVIPIFMVCVLVFMMMAQGASNVAGQFLGARKPEQAGQAYCAALVINTVLGGVAALALSQGATTVAGVLGLAGETQVHGAAFLHAIAPALLLISVKYGLACVFISHGKTIWNMFGGLLAIAVNIGLNIRYQRMGMGIEGVALATIMAQVAVIVFYVAVIALRMKVSYHWSRFMREMALPVRTVLRIGVPSVVMPVSSEMAMLVIAAAAVHLGTEAMAARVYVMNLATVALCWAAAVSIGNQVLVAILTGARQPVAADAVLRRNLVIAIAGSLVIAALLRLAGPQLVGIFTQDPRIIAISLDLLTVGLVLEAARSFGTLTSFALKAAGDANFPALVGVSVTWCVAVPLALYLCLYTGAGMVGLWLGLAVDEGLRGAINFMRWNAGVWQSKSVAA